jgi:hypothetical protein
MRHSFKIAAVAAIFPVLAVAGQANALTLVLPGPSFSGDFIWNNDGTVSLTSAPLIDYTAIQQQSELYSDFSSGSTLPAGSLMELSFAIVAGADHHTVSFLHNFGTVPGAYSWSYDISDAATPGVHEASIDAAILQTAGVSSLLKTVVDNNSHTYTVDFTQTGVTDSGVTAVTFLPGATTLDVVDTITTSSVIGSNASGVSNSFIEGTVPETSTWMMMLLGFAGLGFAGYRSSRKGISRAG